MVRLMRIWATWLLIPLCACTSAVPVIRGQPSGDRTIVLRPGHYRPVDLPPEEFQQAMRLLTSHGPLPGLTRAGASQLVLVSASPAQAIRFAVTCRMLAPDPEPTAAQTAAQSG